MHVRVLYPDEYLLMRKAIEVVIELPVVPMKIDI